MKLKAVHTYRILYLILVVVSFTMIIVAIGTIRMQYRT